MSNASHIGHVHPAEIERARAGLRNEADYAGLAALFAALADPTRAKIIHMLLLVEMCTSDLAVVAGISDSAVSQHLRVLRALRLVRSRRSGKFLYHSLDDNHVALLVQLGLAHGDEVAREVESCLVGASGRA